LWISIGFVFIWSYVAASGYVSGDTLTLDQVPEYRGTLMSLNILARNLGATIGGLLGGSLLLFSNYTVFGFV
jgi:predicted MFS family arabinose efflux permease